MKGNDEIHRLRHHSSLKLFLPTAENEKAHNLWIKLTFTKCQCQLDRQGWLERSMSKSTKIPSSSWSRIFRGSKWPRTCSPTPNTS